MGSSNYFESIKTKIFKCFFAQKILNTVASQYGSEVSLKTFEHYIQLFFNEDFCPFDYGKSKNLNIYGSSQPPPYPLTNITAPQYFIYSEKDSIAVPKVRFFGKIFENYVI